MIAIVDYGVGNLFSLKSSLARIGREGVITDSEEVLLSAGCIILPGVGAFGDAADKLRAKGLDRVVIKAAEMGIPILGICLGMQLLFEKGYEYGEHDGLGLIEGGVYPLDADIPADLKIPHIGWNSLTFSEENCPIFKYIQDGDFVYFVHSYYAKYSDHICAFTDYGTRVAAAAHKNNVYGCQFHPEKSGETGLNILKAFCELEDER